MQWSNLILSHQIRILSLELCFIYHNTLVMRERERERERYFRRWLNSHIFLFQCFAPQMWAITLWDVTPCSLVEIYRCFRGTCSVCQQNRICLPSHEIVVSALIYSLSQVLFWRVLKIHACVRERLNALKILILRFLPSQLANTKRRECKVTVNE